MNIGISSYTFAYSVGVPGKIKGGYLSPEDLVDRAVEFDCTVLQIADNLPLHTLSRERTEDLRKRADKAGVTIELGTAGTGPERIKTYLELAGPLGSSILRTVCGPVSSFEDQKAIVSNLMRIISDLEKSGVVVCLENTENIAAEALADIVRQINSPNVAVCLDVANSLGRGEGVREVVELLGPYTRNLHVKDCKPVRVPTNLGFIVQGCKLGEGIIDFEWIIRKLDGGTFRDAAVRKDGVQGKDPPTKDRRAQDKRSTDRRNKDFNIILEQWTPRAADEKTHAVAVFTPDSSGHVRAETEEEIRKREKEWAAYGVDYLKRLI